MVRDLREQVLQKYLHLPSSHFDTEATPVMVSRLNFDTEQVTQASADALKTVVADTLTIVAMLAVMLQMSVKVTLAMLLVVPLIGGIVSYVGKRYRRISRGIQDGMGTMAQTAEQSLAAQQEVKVHGTQQHEISRYSRLANRMLALNMKVEVTRAAASSVVQFLAALALAVIVWVSTREALAGRLNAGQFMGLMTSMMAIIPSLRRLTSVQTSISRGVSAAERLFGILDMPVERDQGQRRVQRVRANWRSTTSCCVTARTAASPGRHQLRCQARHGDGHCRPFRQWQDQPDPAGATLLRAQRRCHHPRRRGTGRLPAGRPAPAGGNGRAEGHAVR